MKSNVIRIDFETWRKTEATMRRILGAKSFQEASSEVADAFDEVAQHHAEPPLLPPAVRVCAEAGCRDCVLRVGDPLLPGMSEWLRKQGKAGP